jgi:hypothetical protein
MRSRLQYRPSWCLAILLGALAACSDPAQPLPPASLALQVPEALYQGEASSLLLLPDSAGAVRGLAVHSSDAATISTDAFGRLYPHAVGQAIISVADGTVAHPRELARITVQVLPARVGVRRLQVLFAPGLEWSGTVRAAAAQAAMRWQRVLAPNPLAVSRSYPVAWCFRDSIPGDLQVGPDVIPVTIEQFIEDTAGTRTVGYGGNCISGHSGTPLAIRVAIGDRTAAGTDTAAIAELLVHEIGHGLGLVGVSWDYAAVSADPVMHSEGTAWFTGPRAVAAWRTLGHEGASAVPLDGDGFHWSGAEAAVIGELMYPYLTWGSARIGPLTLGALADIGNPVRADRAESPARRLGLPDIPGATLGRAGPVHPDRAFPGPVHLVP